MRARTQRTLLAVAVLVAIGPAPNARAGVDAPGAVICDFFADEQIRWESFDTLPAEAVFSEANTQDAFFSTDASRFGEAGVLIWAGFPLAGDAAGPRFGMLLLDLDLSRAPADDLTPMPRSAIRAEYLEKRGDQIVFSGEPAAGDVWIVDLAYSSDDKGAVEGDFAFLFHDPDGPGSRVLLRGLFISDPSPSQLRQRYGGRYEGSDEYVTVGCSGDLYLADDGSGCGGSDPDTGGCEGDTSVETSGCEGDSGGSGCEGDTADSCSGCGDTASGCGDAGGGACAGAAQAALQPPRRSAGPLRALTRLLPEITALLFITWLRRRRR